MTVPEQSPAAASEQVTTQLEVAFDGVPARVVAEVVREAERDLRGQVAPGSLEELLHRLAAYRLEQLAVRG